MCIRIASRLTVSSRLTRGRLAWPRKPWVFGELAGAHVLDTEVVVDGNITTSYGLGGAIPFALELVRQLAGEAEADRIRSAIAYRH